MKPGATARPLAFDFFIGGVVLQLAGCDDAPGFDRDVAAHRIAAASVVDHAVADDEVDAFGGMHAAGKRREQ